MKKAFIITFSFLILTFFISSSSLALQFSKTAITEQIAPKEEKTVQVIITNDKNLTEEINLFSTDEKILTASPNNFTLPKGSSKTINLYLKSPGSGTYTAELVIVATSDIYRIPVTITSTQQGTLEPTFSKLILTVEPDTVTYRSISFRNKYDDRIEIKDIQVLDAITTQEGTRPISVKSAQLGWLEPGKDLTVEIEINTKKLDYPKTYNPRLVIVYYYKNERSEVEVQFQINVQKSLTTVSKTMNLLISPKEPKPGDTVSAILVGENNETIAGKIFVSIYDSSGSKISHFQFLSPFMVESGKRYCFKGEAEYYETVEKCVEPKLKVMRIDLSIPNPKPNETVIIKVVDLEGNVIPEAKLSIDGKSYDSPQVTAMFDKGTHVIVAQAPGMETVSTTITVEPELKILNYTEKVRVNEPFTMLLNKEAFYIIYFNDKPILNGTSSNITFIPKQVGNYTIMVEDKKISFVPESGWFLQIPGMEFIVENWVYIVVAVAIIIVIIIVIKKRKKEEGLLEIPGQPSLGRRITIRK